VYQPGMSGFSGCGEKSLFEVRLRFQEEMDAQFGRFCVPEERPFTEGLPQPRRTVTLPHSGLAIDAYDIVNLTEEIASGYQSLVEKLCRAGDDGQYGSSVEHDVYALQAIARRIHYGSLYVAESKFISAPQSFGALIEARDCRGLLELLTRKDVEEKILCRVREKTVAVQATVNCTVRQAIDSDIVVEFYRECIIPLTKKGEVLYLLNRKTRDGI
jgi:chorismate mutase